MRILALVIALIAQALVLQGRSGYLSIAPIPFYHDRFELLYNPEIVFSFPIQPGRIDPQTGRSNLESFYHTLERKDWKPLLASLEAYRQELGLNDWFYFEFLRQAVSTIFWGKSENHRVLVCWFYLSKAGYDTRITYRKGEVFLNVHSEDEIYEIPVIQDQGRTFVNISHPAKPAALESLYILDFVPNPQGKPFSFALRSFPKIQPRPVTRTLSFRTPQKEYLLTVQFDRAVVDMMRDYPYISENQYLEAPLSPTLAESLLPALRKLMRGKSWYERLRMLAAFTRSAFLYKTDEEVYGRSKPMIPEEVFFYRFSDCEDRSALFYALQRELIGLPMIAIAYEDHVTIGVATPRPIGKFVHHQGKRYYLCDPTGPQFSTEIGFFPQGYEDKPFQVISHYPAKGLPSTAALESGGSPAN